MYFGVRLRLGGMIAAAALVLPTLAAAATVDLQSTALRPEFAVRRQAGEGGLPVGAAGAQTSTPRTSADTRPGGPAEGTQDLTRTAVGSFTPFGETGSGLAKIGDGGKLQVRADNVMPWGRYSTVADGLGGNWLDSNDNLGMKWEIGGVGKFDAVAFFVTDAADVGGNSRSRSEAAHDIAGDGGLLANGNIHFVKILLDEAVDSLTVELMHDRANDGFGIDGAAVGRIAPVPLPPAVLLLGAGFAALAGLRRRRTARA